MNANKFWFRKRFEMAQAVSAMFNFLYQVIYVQMFSQILYMKSKKILFPYETSTNIDKTEICERL